MAKVAPEPDTAVEAFGAEDLRAATAADAPPSPGPAVPTRKSISTHKAVAISEASMGKKICILQCGSRGDAQPIIALAAHLKDVGFNILILGTINACPFMETFGIDCIPVHPDSEQRFRDDPLSREAMASGKLLPMLRGSGDSEAQNWPTTLLQQYEHIKAFKPDMLCSSYVDLVSAQLFSKFFEIPCIMLWLQPLIPSKYKKSPFNEKHFHYAAWMACMRLGYDGYKNTKYPMIEATLGKIIPDVLSYMWPNFECMMQECIIDPITINTCGFDEVLYNKGKDWPKHLGPERFSFQGFWVVSPAEQEIRMEAHDSAFGGTDIDDIKQFLADGEPPLYLGWGSMIAVSPEHMIRFAVRTCMALGKRGIILGGFAQLQDRSSRKSSVVNQPDEADLVAYMAADKILFVQTAPHEWLFPRCAVSVHHGGSGTTAVALRSGKPTIITPCFLDQFGNAEMVARCGCGIHLKQFQKVTIKALSGAITKCLEDTDMQDRCSEMGKRLREVDSCGNTAALIDKFLVEDVGTGRWKQRFEQERENRQAMRKYPKGKKGILRHMCCGSMNPQATRA